MVGQHREGRYSAVRATDRVGHRYVLDGQLGLFAVAWERNRSTIIYNLYCILLYNDILICNVYRVMMMYQLYEQHTWSAS